MTIRVTLFFLSFILIAGCNDFGYQPSYIISHEHPNEEVVLEKEELKR